MSSLAELTRRAGKCLDAASCAMRSSSAQEDSRPLVPTVAPSRERDPLTGGRCELAPIVLDGLTIGQGLHQPMNAPATTTTSASWR